MEKPSSSNFNQNSAPGRWIRLIPVSPRPTLPPPPSSTSSTSSLIPSIASSDNPQAGSPRGVIPGANPEVRLRYPFIFQIGGTRNEAPQPPAPVHPQPPSTERRIPLIPTAHQRNASLEAGPSQPPETFGGKLYADIIREAMAKIPPFNEDEEESHSPSSSSSLRFSIEDDDEESDGVPNGRKRGKTFEELAEETIRDMRKAEEDERQELRGMYKMGGPSQPAARVNNEDPHEGLIREMIDLTGTDDEVDAEEDEWRRNLEETVHVLVVEVAEQREQTTRLANLMERVVSLMDRETQSSNNPSLATSVAPLAGSQQPNTDVAGPSRKRKEVNKAFTLVEKMIELAGMNSAIAQHLLSVSIPKENQKEANLETSPLRTPLKRKDATATTSQPPSTTKRTRHSGSPGGQKKN